jgi:nucleoside-diphosphate-sugar epimerase
MNTKNIAIIGANSILGQAIYERLVDDHTVYQVYNANVTNIKSHKNLIQIEDFLKSNLSFDVIYFISAVITFEESSTKINQLFFTNVNLLKTISETFATSKIINASSVAVFQESNHTLIETSPLLPKSSYALSKLWAEHLVATHQGGGVNIRISSLYGVGMKKNTFLPKMMQSAIQNKKIIIFGDGSRKQNYISAKEAADYFCDAMHYAGSMPLLAVGKQSYSNLEMANMLVEMQSEVKIELEGQDNSSSFTYDNTLTKQELRSNQDYSFYELIKEVLEWMQKQY